MGQRDRDHIVVPFNPDKEPFQSPRGGGGSRIEPPSNRRAHGQRLKNQLSAACPEDVAEDRGTYVTFESFPGMDLALEMLDLRGGKGAGITLLNAKDIDASKQEATVFIPYQKRQYFFDVLDSYIDTAEHDNPERSALVERIQHIRRTTIRSLWTDDPDLLPSDSTKPVWWEVWLRRRNGLEIEPFQRFANAQGLIVKDKYLGFSGRTIFLVKASLDQLANATDSLDDLAELRKPHEVSTAIVDLEPQEHKALVTNLIERINEPDSTAPAVCILDRGIAPNHPLLDFAIEDSDHHVANPRWKTTPFGGHGTEMAGLALYGDLQTALTMGAPVHLHHRLESVKILPDDGSNEPEFYGQLTAEAVLGPEIEHYARPRVFMMAVTDQAQRAVPNTTEEQDAAKKRCGVPTSWSAVIDALAFGRNVLVTDDLVDLDPDLKKHSRLFVISTGNADPQRAVSFSNYLDHCDLAKIEDPSQAWNAITVGAYSSTDTMEGADPLFAGYIPVAPRGELSPASRTAMLSDSTHWPFKPDVVADGGNFARSPNGELVDSPENLALVTTRNSASGGKLLTTTRDTSAATAQVAAIAADIAAAYPTFKAETIRALVVHSAEWTDAMLAHFDTTSKKRELSQLVRRYGMGVPDRDRAIRSAANALNLVVEGVISPFVKKDVPGDMHIHKLPWPRQELEALDPDAEVRMRVTLSYFVDPNPSRRGWKSRYRYASHGLRFASINPTETEKAFRERINKLAREDDSSRRHVVDDGWLFGREHQQKPGSLHTDIWVGPGAELASKSLIAVYPVSGWWKYASPDNRLTRSVAYSLVVSIESPDVEVDLWTPIQAEVQQRTLIDIPGGA